MWSLATGGNGSSPSATPRDADDSMAGMTRVWRFLTVWGLYED